MARSRLRPCTTCPAPVSGSSQRPCCTCTCGSAAQLPCQLLLIAAGFLGAESYLPEALGLTLTDRRRVDTPAEGHSTARPKVFAAGDMRRGQSLVVWAIAEGRSAAAEVDRYLFGYTNLARSLG